MKSAVKFPRIFSAAIVLTLCTVLFASALRVSAEEITSVSNSAEFKAALLDNTVSTININAAVSPTIELGETVNISRTLTINGQGAVLSVIEDGQLTTSAGSVLTLNNVSIKGESGYAVAASGTVALGESSKIDGVYGVLLRSDGSLTTNGKRIDITPTVSHAIGISTDGGKVTVSNVKLVQPEGEGSIIYVNPLGGSLLLGGTVHIEAASGNAIMCPAGGKCPDVIVSESSSLFISAPKASNSSGNEYYGAAVDIRSGRFTLGKESRAEIMGSSNAVIANSVELKEQSAVKLGCSLTGRSGNSGSGNAALWVGDKLTTEAGVSIDMFDSPIPSNGIYAGGGIELGDGCSVRIQGNGGQYSAVCTPESFVAGMDSSVELRKVRNGIVCDHGMTTGSRVSITMAEVAEYGIHAIGTLQAEKLFFGERNTLNIDAGVCAIYTRESVDITEGSRVTLSGQDKAPALWVDADTDSQGHLAVDKSEVYVTSRAGSGAVHNAGVYVVGAVTMGNGTVFSTINDGDFGMVSVYGDINISTDSKVYTSGGCGIYLLGGNLRLTQGGALYAEGRTDSGARVEHGVLNAGEATALDVEGARFGVEVLGNGGVWMNGVSDFDIRSITDRAVYIQNGSLNISGMKRLSAWVRGDDKDNRSRWWSGQTDGMHSWEIRERLPEEQRLYADYTMRSPNGTQEYSEGYATVNSGLEWFNGTWLAESYSRLGIYTSRPIARSNTFFIPAGKSFSWWLFGETYNDEKLTYELVGESGDGECKLGENGRFTCIAPAYARGMYNIDYIVRDSSGLESESATVSINITASKPPIACSDTYVTKASTQLLGQLEMYDYDGRIASTAIAVEPEHGALLVSSDGQFSYTPNVAFNGIDVFAYYAVDDMGDKSNIGYISVVVGEVEGVVLGYDTLIAEADTPVETRLYTVQSESVSSSDAAVGGQLSYVITQQPVYGKLEFSSADELVYTPYEDFSGSDIFRCMAVDESGRQTNEALITVATIPNQRPSVSSASYSCVRGSACKGKLGAEDIDGTVMSFRIEQQPEIGSIKLNKGTGEFTYRAPFDAEGTVSFTYTATDNDGLTSHTAVVEIRMVSLVESLRENGQLTMAMAAIACIAVSVLVIITLIISRAVSRKREKRIEEEKERLMEMVNRR